MAVVSCSTWCVTNNNPTVTGRAAGQLNPCSMTSQRKPYSITCQTSRLSLRRVNTRAPSALSPGACSSIATMDSAPVPGLRTQHLLVNMQVTGRPWLVKGVQLD